MLSDLYDLYAIKCLKTQSHTFYVSGIQKTNTIELTIFFTDTVPTSLHYAKLQQMPLNSQFVWLVH